MAEQLRHMVIITGDLDLTTEQYHKRTRDVHKVRLLGWATEWETKCKEMSLTPASALIQPQAPVNGWSLPIQVKNEMAAGKTPLLVLSATSIMRGQQWQLVQDGDGKNHTCKNVPVITIATKVRDILAASLQSGTCFVLVACCYGGLFVAALKKLLTDSQKEHLVVFFWTAEVPTDKIHTTIYGILNGPASPHEDLYKHVKSYLQESYKFWRDPTEDGVEPTDSAVDWSETFRGMICGEEVGEPSINPTWEMLGRTRRS